MLFRKTTEYIYSHKHCLMTSKQDKATRLPFVVSISDPKKMQCDYQDSILNLIWHEFSKKLTKHYLLSEHLRVAAAYHKGCIVGCCFLTWTFDDNCFYLESLCVKEYARNNGIGRSLIQVCQDEASQQNNAPIVLHVDKINQNTGKYLPQHEILVKYYQKSGFEIVRQNDLKDKLEVKMIWRNGKTAL